MNSQQTLEKINYFYLFLSIAYILLYYFISDFIIIYIPNGFELSILLFIISGTYTLKFTLEQIKAYFEKKESILSKFLEILFGSILIFLLDLIPFIIDFKSNKFTLVVGLSFIILYSVYFIINFVLKPICNLYYKLKLYKLDKEKEKELQELEENYQKRMNEINKN